MRLQQLMQSLAVRNLCIIFVLLSAFKLRGKPRNIGGHRVGAIDLNAKTNSTRRLRCTTWFTRSAMTTARAIAAVCQCTRSESPWEIERPNLRSALQASVVSVGIDRRRFVFLGRVDRALSNDDIECESQETEVR